jgi:hypothetical protein
MTQPALSRLEAGSVAVLLSRIADDLPVMGGELLLP